MGTLKRAATYFKTCLLCFDLLTTPNWYDRQCLSYIWVHMISAAPRFVREAL